MFACEAVDGLSALAVGHIGDGTRVYDADVGTFAFSRREYAMPLQNVAQGGRLCEVELASQSVECRALII